MGIAYLSLMALISLFNVNYSDPVSRYLNKDFLIPFNSEFETGKSLIRLEAGYTDDKLSFDPFVIYIEERATFGFDGQYDAYKMYNTDNAVTNFFVFGSDDSRLSICGIPSFCDDPCYFKVGLKTEKDGEILIRIRNIEGSFIDKTISLIDTKTNTSTILSSGEEFRIKLTSGDHNSRFVLKITKNKSDAGNTLSMEKELNVYLSHGVIIAEISLTGSNTGIITLCDPAGRVKLNQKVSSGRFGLHPTSGAGLYIISLRIDDKKTYRKVMVSDQK